MSMTNRAALLISRCQSSGCAFSQAKISASMSSVTVTRSGGGAALPSNSGARFGFCASMAGFSAKIAFGKLWKKSYT
jgi:hypothetical protein